MWVKDMKKILQASLLIFLLGCVPTFYDHLATLRPGMTKEEVDTLFMDKGKWVGTVNTRKGVSTVWGYPSSSYGPSSAFNAQRFKRFYFFFEEGKYVKYTNSFDPSNPEGGIIPNISGSSVGPSRILGGGRPGGRPGGMGGNGVGGAEKALQ